MNNTMENATMKTTVELTCAECAHDWFVDCEVVTNGMDDFADTPLTDLFGACPDCGEEPANEPHEEREFGPREGAGVRLIAN